MALAFPTISTVQVFVLMTMNISTFSLGTMLAAGSGRPGFRALLRQPSLYAISLALLLKALHVEDAVMKSFVWEPLGYTERALISFALVTLGVQLSQTKPPPIAGAMSWALVQRLLGRPPHRRCFRSLLRISPGDRRATHRGRRRSYRREYRASGPRIRCRRRFRDRCGLLLDPPQPDHRHADPLHSESDRDLKPTSAEISAKYGFVIRWGF